MKAPLKAALLTTGAAVLLVLGALSLAPLVLKDRVVELVEAQLSRYLDATVTFEDVELSLFSTFPTLTIELSGAEVACTGAFEGVKLASVRSFRAGVDLVRLIRDEQLLIESATAHQPELYLLVNQDGAANYDLVTEADEEDIKTEDAPSALTFRLRRFDIIDGRLEYESPASKISLEGLEQDGSAAIDGATYAVSSSTTVRSLTVQVGGVRYIRNAHVNVDLGAVLRADDKRLAVDRLVVALNELSGEASGTVEWGGAEVALDLALASGKGQSIRALVSTIPGAYAGDLSGLQATGTYALRAKVAGPVRLGHGDVPAFAATLFVRNGTLQDRGLPRPLTDISIDARAKHPGGPLDRIAIDVRRFTARAGQSHVEGRLAVTTPLSRPHVELAAEGRCDLAELAEAYPLNDEAEVEGTVAMNLDLAAKGDLVQRHKGWMVATAVAYRPKDAPDIEVSAASLKLTRRATQVQSVHGTYGQSDLALKGSLAPLHAFVSRGGPITGDLQLVSRTLYLDEMLEGEETVVSDRLDITIAAKAETLIHKALKLPDMRGIVRIKDGDVALTDVTSDAGRNYAEALISSLKGHGILVMSRGRPRLVSPLKVR